MLYTGTANSTVVQVQADPVETIVMLRVFQQLYNKGVAMFKFFFFVKIEDPTNRLSFSGLPYLFSACCHPRPHATAAGRCPAHNKQFVQSVTDVETMNYAFRMQGVLSCESE